MGKYIQHKWVNEMLFSPFQLQGTHLKPSSLTGTCLFLHRHNLQHFILKLGSQEVVNYLELLEKKLHGNEIVGPDKAKYINVFWVKGLGRVGPHLFFFLSENA